MYPITNKNAGSRSAGFTLIEIMVAIAVIGIITAIAVPTYREYILSSRANTMEYNMASLRVLMEDYRLDNGDYGAVGTLNGEAAISNRFNWHPDSDLGGYTFTMNVMANTYDIWVVHDESGNWRRCDDRMSSCCGDEDLPVAACP